MDLTPSPDRSTLETLATLLEPGGVVALTGAGVSTESGIPDYRSPEALARPRKPIQGPDFVRSESLRRRYWARAMVGWESFRHAQPGPAHHALARLEAQGTLRALITQNVDRLHHAAGSRTVVELHGALAEVICLGCGALEPRERVQQRLIEANRGWKPAAAAAAPDGDAELSDGDETDFRVPACERCAGVLKPNVVFFGHNVARDLVDRAYAMVDDARVLLIAGTSLAVFSGYRFLLRAVDRKLPVVIINRGPVRGEAHGVLKLDASTGATLDALARRLSGETPRP